MPRERNKMDKNLKEDEVINDEDAEETKGFFKNHPILSGILVGGLVAIGLIAILDSRKYTTCENAACVKIMPRCGNVLVHKPRIKHSDNTQQSDKSNDSSGPNDGTKPTFAKSTGVGFYTFTVESKEDLRAIGLAYVHTEVGYDLKINLADDRQDYNKLYDSLQAGHTYTCEVREDLNSPSGMYAFIVNCDK